MDLSCKTREILVTLTHRVRYLTLEQVKEVWWPAHLSGAKLAARALGHLRKNGLIEVRKVLFHPILNLEGPVGTWCPGQKDPFFGRVSYRLQSRWTENETEGTIYYATQKTVKRFGGAGKGLVYLHQVTHDLHCSVMYLWMWEQQPERAAKWVPEFLLKKGGKRHEKTPDAAIREEDGRLSCILEFGGRYDARRVAQFHEYCASKDLPYEIW